MVEGIARRGNVGNACSLSQVLVTARMSIVLEIIRSVREAVFSRMLVVVRRMLCLITGPELRLTSPASSSIKANLNVAIASKTNKSSEKKNNVL